MAFELYAVQNSDGKWFHRKGFGGYGETWCAEPHKARIYTKIGQARAQITYFAKNYPAFPVPKLVKLIVDRTETIDETERVAKDAKKQEKAKVRKELKKKQYLLDLAKHDLERAQKRVRELVT